MGIGIIEHCLIRELCEGVNSISYCPHYRAASYRPHFIVLDASESHQCHHCLTGAKPLRWSDVEDNFEEIARFLRRGIVDYPQDSREEINFGRWTYILTTGLDTGRRATTTFDLREDANVAVLDFLQIWVQNLLSEDEIEIEAAHFEQVLDKLGLLEGDRLATLDVSRVRENVQYTFDTLLNQIFTVMWQHFRGRLGAGPSRSLNVVDDILQEVANRTDGLVLSEAYTFNLMHELEFELVLPDFGQRSFQTVKAVREN
ncbi:uncharacterized protein F4812DRAFT_456100 [Daldinia caldariorum]|uniref:uncharacterized protein n=1 Tax=Daldinia caldariorum TaxID=326644 RepID=UPI0020072B45|nr:uncharacterized protein F4812DRAFT_456100 [Daldinia caldariorum]KAI1472000.1 hypothetical protein F4812DRAFT_456100 [Daldinia caldariorum]